MSVSGLIGRDRYGSIDIYPQVHYCCCSVTQLCPTLCDSMDCSTPGFPILPCLPEFAQIHVHWVGEAIQPSVLCHPLLLLPSIFPSIEVFSNESALSIRWPKYWSFGFSISPSNEYSGLISFWLTGLIFLQSMGVSRVFPAPQFESINALALSLLYGPTLTSVHDYWKNYSFD